MYQGFKKKQLDLEKRKDRSELFKMTHRLTLLPAFMAQQQKRDAKGRALSMIPLPMEAAELRHLSVQAALFLTLRLIDPSYGTLFTALSNGKVLVWSHHRLSGYLEQFNAIHMAGDSVSTLSTEATETYLFTGTMMGYVKTWLLTNYW